MIGHTASHQYYQMLQLLKTIRASPPGMWLESYRLMQFVTDSAVGFDCSTEAKIEFIQLLVLMNQKRHQGRFYEDYLKPLIDNKEGKVLKRKLRVSIRTFKYLELLLYNSTAFEHWKKCNLKSSKFIAISKQLSIFLYFISRNYQYEDIADMFGIQSSSTISEIVNRCANGIHQYKSQFINWHDEESKQKMLTTAAGYGFPNCVALVDGVVNTITSFDSKFTASWSTSKKHYGIVSLVMCDLHDKILFYSTGNCGSRNDSGI